MGASKNKEPGDKISWIVWAHAQAIADTLWEPFLILDDKFQVVMANKAFYETFQCEPKHTEGKKIDTLGDGQWNIPRLRKALDDVLADNSYVENIEFAYNFANTGAATFLMNVRAIYRDNGLSPIVLLAMEDVTNRQTDDAKPGSDAATLNESSSQQSAAFEARIKELERLNKAMVGRELKMRELKQEIKELKKAKTK